MTANAQTETSVANTENLNTNIGGKIGWQAGIVEELGFWERWLATGGGEWPADFAFRCDPCAPLQQHLIDALSHLPHSALQILDVGAGPLTYLGKVWAGHTLAITAVDPLAKEYDHLIKKYAVTPPVRTQVGFAEKLVKQFGHNRFDVVHARNCIDHSYDPCLAIEQMVAVAKPGGLVYMHHAVNEATVQQFQGFHQWNLFDEDGELCVSNQENLINMSKRLYGRATVTNQLFDNGIWMVTQIWKAEQHFPPLEPIHSFGYRLRYAARRLFARLNRAG
ncbi:MAG: methyltransferase domain-containing protein [Caldilineaceae bacterium]